MDKAGIDFKAGKIGGIFRGRRCWMGGWNFLRLGNGWPGGAGSSN